MTPATVRDTLARNTAWYGVVTLAGLLSGIAMSVVLARGLGPARMGDFSFLTWVFRTLEVVAALGFGIALVRYTADALARGTPAQARGVIDLLLRWQLLSVGAVIVGALGLTFALAADDLRWPLVVGVVGLVPAIVEWTFMRATYGAQRYDLTAQVSALKMVLLLTLSTAAVLMGTGLVGIVIGQTLGTIVSCVLQVRRGLSLYPRQGTPVPPAVRLELRRYLLSLSLVCVLETLVWDRSEIFFLRLWVSPEAIAFYSLAFGLASRAAIVPSIFVGPLLPALSALHGAGHDAEFGRVYRAALRSVALFGAPIAAVTVGMAPALVVLLYGEEYRPVAALYRVLMGVSLLGVMRDVAWTALRAGGDRRRTLTATVVTAAVDVGLAALLVRPYGTAGAVIANTAAQVMVAVWAFVALERMKRTGFPVRDFCRIGAAAALAAGATWTTLSAAHGVPALVAGALAGLGTYVVAGVALGALDTRDWAFLVTSGRQIVSFRARA